MQLAIPLRSWPDMVARILCRPVGWPSTKPAVPSVFPANPAIRNAARKPLPLAGKHVSQQQPEVLQTLPTPRGFARGEGLALIHWHGTTVPSRHAVGVLANSVLWMF